MTFKVGDLVSSTSEIQPHYLFFRHGVVIQVPLKGSNSHIRVLTKEHGMLIVMPKEIQMATVNVIG